MAEKRKTLEQILAEAEQDKRAREQALTEFFSREGQQADMGPPDVSRENMAADRARRDELAKQSYDEARKEGKWLSVADMFGKALVDYGAARAGVDPSLVKRAPAFDAAAANADARQSYLDAIGYNERKLKDDMSARDRSASEMEKRRAAVIAALNVNSDVSGAQYNRALDLLRMQNDQNYKNRMLGLEADKIRATGDKTPKADLGPIKFALENEEKKNAALAARSKDIQEFQALATQAEPDDQKERDKWEAALRASGAKLNLPVPAINEVIAQGAEDDKARANALLGSFYDDLAAKKDSDRVLEMLRSQYAAGGVATAPQAAQQAEPSGPPDVSTPEGRDLVARFMKAKNLGPEDEQRAVASLRAAGKLK